MDETSTGIPKDVALQLCAEIREQYQGKWWTLAGMQCMGCTTASRGDLTKMCISNAPGNRGCNLVNARCDTNPITESSATAKRRSNQVDRILAGSKRWKKA